MPTSIGNSQPYLGLTQAFVLQGVFPARDSGQGVSGVTLDMIRTYAFNFAPGGTALAQGQTLSIAQNTAVFSIVGTTYGGDGRTNFAIPDLAGRVANEFGQGTGLSNYNLGQVSGNISITLNQAQLPSTMGGSSQPVGDLQPTLSTGFYINANGIFPSTTLTADTIGVINQFAGTFAPNDAIPCDGRLLQISQYDALFNLIGTTYGGDGVTTFAVPDLRGRTIVGTGQAPGSAHNYILGETGGGETFALGTNSVPSFYPEGGGAVSNLQPYIALNFAVSLQGIFPSQNSGAPDYSEPFIGEVFIYAGVWNGNFTHVAQANGQLLPINQNQALFSLLGTNFGGNGTTNFALPDLRGRVVEGTGAGVTIGQTGGTENFVLTLDNIPDLNFTGGIGNDRMLGGNGLDFFAGGDGNDTIFGAGGADTINGGIGADIIDGGSGINLLNGGADNDRLVVSTLGSGSSVDGGTGTDTLAVFGAVSLGALAGIEAIEFSGGATLILTGSQLSTGLALTTALSGTGTIVVNMDPNVYLQATKMALQAGSNVTLSVNGTAGTDIVKGSLTARNSINGGDGADQIRGGNLADTINGGNGDDKIFGLGGADTLTGGTGVDQFRFYYATDSGLGAASDHVTDFVPGTDKLDFRQLDADPVAIGRQALTYIGTQPFHATPGVAEVRYGVIGGSLLVEADLNGDGSADMQIVLEGIGAQSLAAGDFLL